MHGIVPLCCALHAPCQRRQQPAIQQHLGLHQSCTPHTLTRTQECGNSLERTPWWSGFSPLRAWSRHPPSPQLRLLVLGSISRQHAVSAAPAHGHRHDHRYMLRDPLKEPSLYHSLHFLGDSHAQSGNRHEREGDRVPKRASTTHPGTSLPATRKSPVQFMKNPPLRR